MKTLRMMMAAILMVLAVGVANAQDKNDFAGKWQFLVTGTPQGDSEIVITLVRGDDGKLTGEMTRDGAAAIKLERVDEKKGKSFTAYFKASGYDCYLFAELTGDDEMEGSLMDMFDCTGKRIKE